MLYPLGAAARLRLLSAGAVVAVAASRDRQFVAVATQDAIFIFYAYPHVLLSSYERSESDCENFGHNVHISWKPDGTCICVATSGSCLLLCAVDLNAKEQSYTFREPRDVQLQRSSAQLILKDQIPSLSLRLSAVVHLSCVATRIVPLRDELMLCVQDGWVHRLQWNGTVLTDLSIHVSKIPFAPDQLQSKAEYVAAEGVALVDCCYSPLVGGFAVVLSGGRGGLLTSPSAAFEPSVPNNSDCVVAQLRLPFQQLLAVWAPRLTDARVVAANHRYRLLCFGCTNGELAAYSLDEVTGALNQVFRVSLVVKDNCEVVASLGPVCALVWHTSGSACLAAWSRAAGRSVLALFSVFGMQLWCSADSAPLHAPVSEDTFDAATVSAVDWGAEGYHAWIGCSSGLFVLSCVRCAAINNTSMTRQRDVLLLGADCVYLSPPRSLEQRAFAPHATWIKLDVPHGYLAACWPLKFCAVGDDAKSGGASLCVAGSRGLTHCNLRRAKWRLFGNESQEREMTVTGGLAVWNGFVIAACVDLEAARDEVRFYPTQRQLDNAHCRKFRPPAHVLLLNVCGDALLTYDVESRISLFNLTLDVASGTDAVQANRCAEILTADIVPHPACVVSAQLMRLNHESDAAEFCAGSDTLLLNIAGRLVMLSPQRKPPDASSPTGDSLAQQLRQPQLVASNVEQVWHETAAPADGAATSKPHLTQALWIQSGCRGMNVWLPLFPTGRSAQAVADLPPPTSYSFISKRIMLPFTLGIYPLALCSHECLALGVESVIKLQQGDCSTVHRVSEVFLHHILRQLLKRNLGMYALEIAATCRHLPYFGHALELLLHQVLEEEATSSEAIPDPLLPRVVAFIQEFPEFLQTVAHCARKTELALWQHLFGHAGNPRELFDVCIRDNQLATAASFLIVLQNMESADSSKQHATHLLEASLRQARWDITREIVRFLKAIDPLDIESPPPTPVCQAKQQAAIAGRLPLVSPTADDADAFVFGSFGVSRQRQSSSASPPADCVSMTAAGAKAAARKRHVHRSGSGDSATTRRTSSGDDNPVHVFLNLILTKHARHLLSNYRLRDLGAFAAHLDFHLVLWLSRERSRAARVRDTVAALTRLHSDFHWPYPMLSSTVVEHISKKMAYLKTDSFEQPLQVITKRGSSDSGFATNAIDRGLSRDNDLLFAEADDATPQQPLPTLPDSTLFTKRLLMKQHAALAGNDQAATVKAVLAPKLMDNGSVAGTEMTEESWFNLNSPSSAEAETASAEGGSGEWELERLCGDAGWHGPPRREAELRFLQQIALEAVCVEWSLLIALLLRDLVGLARAVNAAALAQCPDDTLRRLRDGVQQLDDWADHHCLGYKPLTHAAMKHLAALMPTDSDDELFPMDQPAESASTRHDDSLPRTATAQNGVLPARTAPKPTADSDGRSHGAERGSSVPTSSPSADFHVDIVSPVTPEEQADRACRIM